MRRVGIIGVGLLGSAVAGRLLRAGFTVAGYDVRREAVEALARDGLEPAGSVAAAAREAEAVVLVLPSLHAVDEVVRGPGGLLETAPTGTTVLQMSTISTTLTRALAEAAAARGLGFLDTPMSGTSAMVARGDCTLFVGGEAALVARCRPVLDAIAPRILHVGPAGAASLAKLATNLLVGLHTAALAEALVLGAKGGLDPRALLDVFRGSAATSKMVEIRGPLMVERRFEPQMKLDLFLKDFQLMLDEAQRLGVALPLTSLVKQLCVTASAAGHGTDDLAAVVTTFQTLAAMEG